MIRSASVPAAVVAALVGFAAGRLFSEDAPTLETLNRTAGGKLVEEVRTAQDRHVDQVRKLRAEIRRRLKVVRRSRHDAALADQARTAPGEIARLVEEVLAQEAGQRARLSELVASRREALVQEVVEQMIAGKPAHPGLWPCLVSGLEALGGGEKAEWDELFKLTRTSPGDDDGGEEDETID